MNDETRLVNANPDVSVHKTSVQDRALGRAIQIEVSQREELDGVAYDDLAGDIFHHMYKRDPQVLQGDDVPPSRAINHRLINWMADSPGFRESRQHSTGSVAAARAASGLMYQHLTSREAYKEALEAQQKAEEKQKEQQEKQAAADALQGMPGMEQTQQQMAQEAAEAQAAMEQLIEQAQQSLHGLEEDAVARASLLAASKKAGQEAREVQEQMKSWGLGDGADLQTTQRFMEMNTERLKRIAKIAGRMHGIAAQAHRVKVAKGFNPVDIVVTQDVPNLLPEELARLSPTAHPIIRKLAQAQFAQNGMMGYKLGGTGDESGDFIFMGDRSGSMWGDDMETMLGIALGLAKLARDMGRRYVLGTFNHAGGGCPMVTSEDTWEDHMIWANQEASGGTSFDQALQYAMEALSREDAKQRGADLVFTTDGWGRVSDRNYQWWLDFQEEHGARFLYVPVNAEAENANPRLNEMADKVIPLDDMTGDSDDLATAVGGWLR